MRSRVKSRLRAHITLAMIRVSILTGYWGPISFKYMGMSIYRDIRRLQSVEEQWGE